MSLRQQVPCPACGTTYSSEPDFCSVCGNSFVGWATHPRCDVTASRGDLADHLATPPTVDQAEIDRLLGRRDDQPGIVWLIVAVLMALLLAWLFRS
jgi:hypothetical protein